MKGFRKSVIIPIAALIIIAGCAENRKPDYPIRPVPFTSVKLTDSFWAPRILKNEQVTIPIAFGYCESTGRIKNFEIAGGLDTGTFRTIYPFDDSDVFKIIEGAAFSLQTIPDEKLDAYLDTLIWKIGLAQEDDGYLYTNRTIAEKHGGKGLHEWAGTRRWELDSVLSHELYNLGHLYEAAAAHFQATGKRTLLEIALKSADLVNRDFGYDRLKVYPGHQVIEMGLVKLFRITGNKKYLDLAKFFLDIRENGQEYNQAHSLPVNQSEAVGHAVRATYMYSGMADIAALTGDKKYLNAITKIWEDIVYRKMYVTGGIGSSGGNEGFAGDYFLPNLTAYCETCASIGDIFFNHRLFLFHGDGKYYDILEKTLYNSMLSGVSLSADRFFYPNPLESDGRHKRQAWFGCACCPSNVARFLPAIPGYIYAASEKNLFVNLYISNKAEINMGTGTIKISQKSGFPWDGKVSITVSPGKSSSFTVNIRIPGWAENEAIPGGLYTFAENQTEKTIIYINGKKYHPQVKKGYAAVKRKWKNGDIIEVKFPFNVRRLNADPKIKDDAGKTGYQRGPVIYCAEWPDNNTGNVRNLVVDTTATPAVGFKSDLPEGTVVINVRGYQVIKNEDGSLKPGDTEEITLIPYALWNNRGPGEMRVWLAKQNDAAIPPAASGKAP
ncbi:MAG: glycoside hydrolase family 127 protein [Bacteroidales bacterium]|nr:glycoside hydrolase family 127 protein [Bacteroidales bacterium]